ncbi:TRAPP trafficking subunit Trs65-domain-containing protein [Stachybotrys elegans]|uniref:TRAPP trafficking subunit Trs65-domain-containing protein n=1 Tax=Stachybotrys elegans TaxID=80388 RepID=A0A8K0WWK7_9HYPO|nr:TRAPP trafficking subunit Trs65-domain-containing protein [Stachybotrys elegans]
MSGHDEAAPDDLPNVILPLQQDPVQLFADKSYLSYFVPSETDQDISKLLSARDDGRDLLQSIEQRDTLFFDETVEVLLVLKIPWLEEDVLRSQLARLVVSLEAQVTNGATGSDRPGGPTAAAAVDTIFTGIVQDVNSPFTVINEEESEGATDRYIYAAWKLPVYLSRPRIRLQNPTVILSAFAGLKPEAPADLVANGRGYLQSGIPSGFNLLQSFSDDPALAGAEPRLSALRVSRVAPVARQTDLMSHIQALQQLQFTIYPVVHTRIRFSRPNTAPPSSSVVALLEVDFTPHVECEVLLDKIDLSVQDATIHNLNDGAALKLPLSCVSHDHITFLYHITPHVLDVTAKNPIRDLDISISGLVQIVPGLCTPRLSMSWTTPLDFTTPVNPGFGPATGAGIQRAHRPSQLSISGGQAITSLKSPSITRPDALPVLEAATTRTEAAIPDLGITMSFTGPESPVRPGDIFSWNVYVVNRVDEKSNRPARKFALVAVPKRRRNEVRAVRPPSMTTRKGGDTDMANAILDENVLHAMQKSSVMDPTDVVCLSADTRVGPLAPGACHAVDMQFLALKEGVVGVEAIRVVDLASQEHVDIRDLPMVVVQAAA